MLSPPRRIDFAQRDYGVDKQIGREPTPDCLGWATGRPCGVCYVCTMVAVCRELKRVLRKDGTFWLNLGDKFSSGSVGSGGASQKQDSNRGSRFESYSIDCRLPQKNLIGIPWRVALALQADGWILRSDIIWHAPNKMPGSQQDRPSNAHEYLFLFAQQQKYFYDEYAIREPGASKRDRGRPDGAETFEKFGKNSSCGAGEFRTKRSVWTIPTQPTKDAHFATFPEKLILPCILAGTSQKGCCPDCGAPHVRIIDRERVATRPGLDTKVTGDSAAEGNRDPQRHVTRIKTVGWKPGCRCYNVEIIAEQPVKPTKPELMDEWETKISEWRRQWDMLSPVYDELKKVPCVVLDPFAGSGTTLAAAIKKGRDAIGIELNTEYIEILQRKLARAEAQKGFGL